MTTTMPIMKPIDQNTFQEFRMPWISRFMICATLVPFAASIGIAVYWREYLWVEPLSRWAVALQVFALIAVLGQLWTTQRAFIRLYSDRIEMRTGFRLRTIMKSDIGSVGWFTTRGPTLKLRDEASTLIRVPMLDGMGVSVLRRWLGSDCADLSEAEAA